MEKQQIGYMCAPTFGCDPELFFEKEGGIVGSEKVIPEQGILNGTRKMIVQDGVQVELHPYPNTCRESLAGEIIYQLKILQDHLRGMKDPIKVCFSGVVEVSKEELDTLSEKSKLLGCAPSLNRYEGSSTFSIDPATYPKRSAGGHIHLGVSQCDWMMKNRERLVDIMDILVGNTCVLIDRDPNAAERRKVYGKAGEYRLPPHGLEYRTLSNFWLAAYPVMSLVFGLSRMAVNVVATSREVPKSSYYTDPYWPADQELLSLVDMSKIRQAINDNDLALAKENFRGVKRFLLDRAGRPNMGLRYDHVTQFEYFAQEIQEKGMKRWFPEEPMAHWCGLDDLQGRGCESFIGSIKVPQGFKGVEPATKEVPSVKVTSVPATPAVQPAA